MSTPADAEVVVLPDAERLAEVVAARLVGHLLEIQASGRTPSWVLTGGTIADRVHAAVAASPARRSLDWAQVELWWGDERFLPSGHPDRNETQARTALLGALPLEAGNVHPMPSPDGPTGDDAQSAASAYARELTGRPPFDVVMLGVGPDGHVASLFPGRPELRAGGAVVAVRDSPKPPPTRLSLTMSRLCRADAVWFVVSGEEKADAVSHALTGAAIENLPAAGPRGRSQTLWLLDEAAGRGRAKRGGTRR